MNVGRRCALPGCYLVIEPAVDGQAQRKYCTPAHRAVARQLRREGTNRSASAPPLPPAIAPDVAAASLPDPAPALPLPPLAELSSARGRRFFSGNGDRRPRAMTWLGSAGLLLTGGALACSMGSDPASGPPAAHTPPPTAPAPDAEQQWAADAAISLAALDQRLADLAGADQAWQTLPVELRETQTTADVRRLTERTALLRHQRAELAATLAGYRSSALLAQDLTQTERRLAELDRAASDAPGDERLRDERTALERRRDAQRQRLGELRSETRVATATPLPAPESDTAAIAAAVRTLASEVAAGSGHRPVTAAADQRERATPKPEGRVSPPPVPTAASDATAAQPHRPTGAGATRAVPGAGDRAHRAVPGALRHRVSPGGPHRLRAGQQGARGEHRSDRLRAGHPKAHRPHRSERLRASDLHRDRHGAKNRDKHRDRHGGHAHETKKHRDTHGGHAHETKHRDRHGGHARGDKRRDGHRGRSGHSHHDSRHDSHHDGRH